MPEEAVAAVSLKLPEFWQTRPRSWFQTAEAQFHLRNITTDATRYFYVVAALGSEVAAELDHVLSNPPDNDKYKALKDALLAIYEPTERQKKKALLAMGSLGDRKPSALLRQMQALHTAEKDDQLFMIMFLKKLLPAVRTILAASDFDDIEDMAKVADRVVDEYQDREDQLELA